MGHLRSSFLKILKSYHPTNMILNSSTKRGEYRILKSTNFSPIINCDFRNSQRYKSSVGKALLQRQQETVKYIDSSPTTKRYLKLFVDSQSTPNFYSLTTDINIVQDKKRVLLFFDSLKYNFWLLMLHNGWMGQLGVANFNLIHQPN